MEFLLPNEIARLVYGYLEEEGCASAAKIFLESSPHLTECMSYAARGRRFNTKVVGLGLVEILDLLAEVTCYIKSIEQSVSKNDVTLGEILHQLKLTLKLGINEDSVGKPVYLRISMPPRSKKRKSKPSEVSPSQPKVVHDSSQVPTEDPSESAVVPNQSHALQVLLENKALHEKLAENINKVVANKSEAESLERILEKKIVETIVNTTEKDPIFQEMLEELVGPAEAINSTPEDIEMENEDVRARLQSGAKQSQQALAGGRNIVEKSMESLGIVAGSIPISTHQVLSVPTTPSQAGHLPRPMLPLVNTAPFQNVVPQGIGHGLRTVPGTPIPPSLSPQADVTQSYVFTTASGKATLSSAMSPLPGGVSPWPSQPGSSALPLSAVPAMPSSRYRNLQPKPPMQSTIRVLHPTTCLPMAGTSMVNVLPNQNSLLQGLLQQVDSFKTTDVTDTPALKVQITLADPVPGIVGPVVRVGGIRTRGGKARVVKIFDHKTDEESPNPPGPNLIPDTPASKLEISAAASSPGIIGPLVRVSGVRTRGGKARVLKTYSGAQKGRTLSSPSTPILSKSEVPNVGDTKPQVSDPSTLGSFTPEPCKKFEPIPEIQSVIAENEDVKSTDKEDTEPDTLEPRIDISINTQDTAETSTALEKPDATPLQGSEPKVKLRKRLSLSTPRKGSHVRTLEFKTPPKGSSLPRKSLSSPKNKAPHRLPQMHEMLQSVKKSELFKSPPKKDNKSWDADLRSTVSNPCEDIPTSVGLKRKEPDLPQSRRKNAPSKMEMLTKTESSSKTPESTGKSETNEEIATRIQRDVLDVIDEEDMNDLNNKSTDSVDSAKPKSPLKSPGTGPLSEIGDIGVPPSTIKKLYSKRLPSGDENSSTLDSPISKVPKETFSMSPPRPQTPGLEVGTPSKIGISPEKSLPNTPGSASLEATLIRECSRIESEGMERARVGSIFGSGKDFVFGEKSDIESPNAANSSGEGLSTGTLLLPPPKGILVLKTPAKSTLPVPVEMTPLSKIINEETRLGKCTLLTPTIPPTPDYEEIKNQNPSITEDKGSPSPVSSIDKSPSNESPKAVSRKSPKTPYKTPLVRFRTKDSKPLASKTKSNNRKKGKHTEIDCNQLIAQCLQSAKESVYGAVIPDSEDDASQSMKFPEKKCLAGHRKSVPKKKRVSGRKKPKFYVADEPKKAEEPSKVNITIPRFAEVIERYENKYGSSSESESGGVIGKDKSEPESAHVPQSSKVDGSVPPPIVIEVPDQSTKTVENTKSLDIEHVEIVAAVAKVNEIESPSASPHHVVDESSIKLPAGKVDLDKYTFECVWLTDDGEQVNTALRTTPFLDIYSYTPDSVMTKPSAEPAKSTNSVNSGDVHERSRRRRRSESISDEEVESNERKRKRIERTYECLSRPYPRRRGRGRPPRTMSSQSRRGAYLPDFRDKRPTRRELSRRPGRKHLESCDEDRRHKSTSSKRSSSYSRDRSRSRPRSECDDRHSPDRNRVTKKREESSSTTRKERPRTPSNEIRRGDRSPREPASWKSSRQEVKADRVSPQRKPTVHVEQSLPYRPEKLLPPVKGKFERPRQARELEEGEISDTSRSTTLSFSMKTSHLAGSSTARLRSPAADESRQALLQRVGVDQLLSFVHGEDKSCPQ